MAYVYRRGYKPGGRFDKRRTATVANKAAQAHKQLRMQEQKPTWDASNTLYINRHS